MLQLLVTGGCGDSSAQPAASPSTAPPVWNVVALGDSDTSGSGDPTGQGWVGRYAHLLHDRLGVRVVVSNLAQEGQTSDALVASLQSDPEMRKALAGAEVVLVGSGGADLNSGDAGLEAGECEAEACYADGLRAFGRNLDAALALVRTLRGPNEAVLRAITLPNVVPGAQDAVPPFITPEIGTYQTRTLRRLICAAAAKHGGRCVDALRAFNGPRGTRDAYSKGWLTKDPCCYPSSEGQQAIAQLVLSSGLAPLH